MITKLTLEASPSHDSTSGCLATPIGDQGSCAQQQTEGAKQPQTVRGEPRSDTQARNPD
jgi:hypothetical protein